MKTLFNLMEDYLLWRKSLKKAQKTLDKNKMYIKKFICWLHSTHQVITPYEIRKEYFEQWQIYVASQTNKEGHPIRPRSINTINESVKMFLKYLADHDHINEKYPDLICYVKKPQFLPKSALSHEQMRKMLNQIPTDNAFGYRDRTMLELLYSSGIRAAELIGLNLDDIDFENKTMMVTGKGNKQRMVPIGKTASSYLKRYIVGIRPYIIANPIERAVFIGKYGRRISYRCLLNRIHVCSQRVGLTDVTTHTFRRTCAIELIRGDANMYHIKELLGHESLDTLRNYARLTIKDLKETHARCHPREINSI